MMAIRFYDITAKEVIKYLKSDGFYKQTGNSRMFVGLDGTRLTIYSPVRERGTWTPYGTCRFFIQDVKITITNSLDEDMVVQDLILSMDGIMSEKDRKSLDCYATKRNAASLVEVVAA